LSLSSFNNLPLNITTVGRADLGYYGCYNEREREREKDDDLMWRVGVSMWNKQLQTATLMIF